MIFLLLKESNMIGQRNEVYNMQYKKYSLQIKTSKVRNEIYNMQYKKYSIQIKTSKVENELET